ncbi:MAG: hypothetical protein COV47_04405 [Candidatus Diapherotrites archaeon CG11_big_fil_rev_8_21_14_0_20_37_9]|nr:MAG: hypothetical protein COV47_04405 [Candidatus Diapherotrites archaeon CG11_big_fil_rev_8_21_14_0_20_37_9]
MYLITKGAAESIMLAAQNTYPNEFFSMLGGKNKTIKELVIVPATYGKNYSTFRIDLVPFDPEIIGTVHSHPSKYNSPSKADLNSFSKIGEIHLIISYPYTFENIAAYNKYGEKTELKLIENAE